MVDFRPCQAHFRIEDLTQRGNPHFRGAGGDGVGLPGHLQGGVGVLHRGLKVVELLQAGLDLDEDVVAQADELGLQAALDDLLLAPGKDLPAPLKGGEGDVEHHRKKIAVGVGEGVVDIGLAEVGPRPLQGRLGHRLGDDAFRLVAGDGDAQLGDRHLRAERQGQLLAGKEFVALLAEVAVEAAGKAHLKARADREVLAHPGHRQPLLRLGAEQFVAGVGQLDAHFEEAQAGGEALLDPGGDQLLLPLEPVDRALPLGDALAGDEDGVKDLADIPAQFELGPLQLVAAALVGQLRPVHPVERGKAAEQLLGEGDAEALPVHVVVVARHRVGVGRLAVGKLRAVRRGLDRPLRPGERAFGEGDVGQRVIEHRGFAYRLAGGGVGGQGIPGQGVKGVTQRVEGQAAVLAILAILLIVVRWLPGIAAVAHL